MDEKMQRLQNDFEEKLRQETFKVTARLDELEKRLYLVENNSSPKRGGNQIEALNAKIELLIQMMDKKDEKYNLRILELERHIKNVEKLSRKSKSQTLETMRSDFNKTANRLMVINESKLAAIESQSQDLFENVAATVEKYEKLFETVKTDLETTSNGTKDPNVKKTQTHMESTNYNDVKKEISLLEYTISNNFNKLKTDLMYFSHNLSLLHSEVYTWKISNMQHRLRQVEFECESELFSLPGYHFQARAKLTLKSNNAIYLSICFKDAKNVGKALGIKVLPNVSFLLKDLSGSEGRKDTIRMQSFLYNSNVLFDQNSHKCPLRHKSWLLNSIYNCNDSIVIKILVEPQSIARNVFSHDGILMWKIDNYEATKRKSKDLLVNYVTSPYFYTSSEGYRVQVRACLNGLASYQGIGVSVIVSFLTGLNDHLLTNNFPHKTTFILYNQTNSTDHLIKSQTHNLRDYSVDLETHNHIEKNGYLLDDYLILKVIVEPTS